MWCQRQSAFPDESCDSLQERRCMTSYPLLETSSSAERAADWLVLEVKDFPNLPPGGIEARRRELNTGTASRRQEVLRGAKLVNNIIRIVSACIFLTVTFYGVV